MTEKTPFFAQEDSSPAAAVEEKSLEEEVDDLTQAEVKKMKRASNLRNANGVDYAPWMNINAEDEEKIRQVMKEKAEARRKRQEQEQSVSGALLMDSQAQELSGGGLRTKVRCRCLLPSVSPMTWMVCRRKSLRVHSWP